MVKTIQEQLRNCKSYDEAKPIVETVGLSVSGHELLKTAYSIQNKQPTVAHQFLNTVIQEMDDEEENKKKIAEVDGGVSNEASQTELPFSGEGTEHDAPESASAQPEKKDQMGVAINEMGGFPPQQMAGGMPPQGQTPCGGQQVPPPMPPQGGAPQQQMQYTVQEVQRQGAILKSIQEALKALDKKVQETAREQPKSLELGDRLGGKGTHSTFPMIQETTGDIRTDLQKTRHDIEHMNDMMNKGLI